MTELTITPKVADKTARFKGAVAAGEHVAVTIKGGAEWLGDDAGANLSLRVLDLVTGRTLAVFPYWTEDNSEDWPDDVTSADAWAPATDDSNDLYCELNLNTTRMVDAARHMLRVPVMFVLGDTDDPRTLYFRDRYEVEYWPERIGDTVPYDLDKWPKRIDEWAEQVAAWTSRMDNLALDAERVDGGAKITLNDGTLETPKEVTVYDGEVSRDEMNTAIAAMGATKQNMLTFDDIPTEESDNPVKSGGVYGAVKEVSDAVTEHTGNAGIHVTATQKTAWTAKYDKPQGGIPKSDLAQAVKDSLGKADTAVQAHQSLDAYVNAAGYDSTAKEIQLKHDSTVVASIDATAFIKDGMVDSVEITGGNLVISFNTDAGVEDIEIPLTDIFNPANYYDKTAADGRFVQKEAGKGLVAVDATLAVQGAAADAKAVGGALRSKASSTSTLAGGADFMIPNVSSLGDGRFVFDNFASDAGGNVYVLKTVEWSLDGVPQQDIGLVADIEFSINGSGAALLLPAQYSVVGDGEFAVVEGFSMRIALASGGNAEYYIGVEAHSGGVASVVYSNGPVGSFDHSDPFTGSFSASFEFEGHAFTLRAKSGWYSFMMTGSEYVSRECRYLLERLENKVTSVTGQSTDAQYPSAKCLYVALSARDAALAQKANATDLPYRLVEPGKWEFSDGLSHEITGPRELYGPDDESIGWIYQSSYNGVTYYSQNYETEALALATLEITFSHGGDSFTATRASLPGHLLDRSGNRVEVTGDTTLTLPAAVPGYLRDFLVRLEISGSAVPTITFAAPTGETITYETDGDDFPVPDEVGNWVYSFTESCVAHTFAVSLKKVNEVAQGGA